VREGPGIVKAARGSHCKKRVLEVYVIPLYTPTESATSGRRAFPTSISGSNDRSAP
jgi:hypothetical protein